MGLFNRFKKKRNHAAEYKSAVENNDMGKMAMIMADWLDNGPKDANFGLAMVILTSMRGDVAFGEVVEIYKTAISQDAEDQSLFDWYNDKAIQLLDKRADEEMEQHPELAAVFNEAKNSNVDQYGGDDSGYAKEFLRLFEIANEGDDPLENIKALSKMADILQEWSEKYPEDANMTCAYVIMKIGYLDKGEVAQLMMRANAQTPIDESCHAELLAHMIKFAMIKNEQE